MKNNIKINDNPEFRVQLRSKSRHESLSVMQSRVLDFLERYYLGNRQPLADETNMISRDIAEEYGADIVSAVTGEECLTWIVPPKWEIGEGYVETSDGKRIADIDWHPFYVESYSVPFSGVISREELLDHVLSSPEKPDRILYSMRGQYVHGERTKWGISIPHSLINHLTDDRYKVHIDAKFTDGRMDVLDWTIPGDTKETVFFAAHSCHPGIVNDGLAGIVLLIELFRWLQQIHGRRYTYRLFVGPEYYAAAVILAKAKDMEKLKCGFFMDMPANGHPLGFSTSYNGNSYVDIVTRIALEEICTDGFIEKKYRELWGNDEIFYDGPGYEIPTVGIGRDHYEEYHTDHDDMALFNLDQFETLDIVKKIITIFENDVIPTPCYKGPLYLSRYGLYIDPLKNEKGYRKLQEIQILMNGERSCVDIASKLGVGFNFVREFISELEKNDLVKTIPATLPVR